jgi:hypothetical protein
LARGWRLDQSGDWARGDETLFAKNRSKIGVEMSSGTKFHFDIFNLNDVALITLLVSSASRW